MVGRVEGAICKRCQTVCKRISRFTMHVGWGGVVVLGKTGMMAGEAVDSSSSVIVV